MSMVTGMIIECAILVIGSLMMMLFGFYLISREEPKRGVEEHVKVPREDVRQLIELIEQLQPLKEKLCGLSGDLAPNESNHRE